MLKLNKNNKMIEFNISNKKEKIIDKFESRILNNNDVLIKIIN